MTQQIQFPEYLEVKENALGFGTYSNKHFKRGDLVMRCKAKIITKCEAEINHTLEISINNKLFRIDSIKCTSILNEKNLLFTIDCFINHSCEPNLINKDFIIKDDSLYYNKYALKNIKQGEEIFNNYLLFESNSNYEFVCKCGSDICFQLIRGKNFLNTNQLEILKRQEL